MEETAIDPKELHRQRELGDTFAYVPVDDKDSKAGVKAGDYRLARVDIITDWHRKGHLSDRQAKAGLQVRDICEAIHEGAAIAQYDGVGVHVRAASAVPGEKKIDAAGQLRMLRAVLGKFWEPVYQLCCKNSREVVNNGQKIRRQQREAARLLDIAANILGID